LKGKNQEVATPLYPKKKLPIYFFG